MPQLAKASVYQYYRAPVGQYPEVLAKLLKGLFLANETAPGFQEICARKLALHYNIDRGAAEAAMIYENRWKAFILFIVGLVISNHGLPHTGA